MIAKDLGTDRAAGRLNAHADRDVLDVRQALALVFGALGMLLAGYGFATRGDAELYVKSGYVNVNLRWGLVLLAFSAAMTLVSLLAAWARRRRAVDVVAQVAPSGSDPLRDR